MPKTKGTVVLPLEKEEIIKDYRLAYQSRQASLIGRREVLSGKAKFGIFGDGKELANIAIARAFQKGDWRSGYYRDQTWMFMLGVMNIQEFFAQLYAHADVNHESNTGGRSMNAHFANRLSTLMVRGKTKPNPIIPRRMCLPQAHRCHARWALHMRPFFIEDLRSCSNSISSRRTGMKSCLRALATHPLRKACSGSRSMPSAFCRRPRSSRSMMMAMAFPSPINSRWSRKISTQSWRDFSVTLVLKKSANGAMNFIKCAAGIIPRCSKRTPPRQRSRASITSLRWCMSRM